MVLSATSGPSIIVFKSVVGAPAGITSANFTLVFPLETETMKKSLAINKR